MEPLLLTIQLRKPQDQVLESDGLWPQSRECGTSGYQDQMSPGEHWASTSKYLDRELRLISHCAPLIMVDTVGVSEFSTHCTRKPL